MLLLRRTRKTKFVAFYFAGLFMSDCLVRLGLSFWLLLMLRFVDFCCPCLCLCFVCVFATVAVLLLLLLHLWQVIWMRYHIACTLTYIIFEHEAKTFLRGTTFSKARCSYKLSAASSDPSRLGFLWDCPRLAVQAWMANAK